MITIQFILILVSLSFIAIARYGAHPRDFWKGSGHYTSIVSAMSIVAAFTGGGAIINTSGLASKYGSWAYFDVLPSALGLLFAALLVRRKFFGKTFSTAFFEMNSATYDRKAVVIHYAEITFLYTLVIAAQLRAVATAASYVNVAPWFAVVFCCVIVAAYAYRGFDAVTKTDIWQLVLMLPMFFILSYVAFEPQHASPIQDTQHVPMPVPLAIALCLPVFFLPISQEIHQRGAAVEDSVVIGRSYLLAAALYLACGLMLVMAFSHTPSLSLLGVVKGDNPMAAVCVSIGILSAILSTLDTSTNIAAHAAGKLPYASRLTPPLLQGIVLATGSVLFLFFPTVLSLILFALFVYMAGPAFTFVAVYAGIHPRRAATIGTIFVTLQTLGQFKYEALSTFPWLPSIIPSFDNVLVGLILILLQIVTFIVIWTKRRLS